MNYINNFVDGFDEEKSLNEKLYFMQSNGGMCTVSNFCGSKSILSGPAGGVVGYAQTTSFLLKNN